MFCFCVNVHVSFVLPFVCTIFVPAFVLDACSLMLGWPLWWEPRSEN